MYSETFDKAFSVIIGLEGGYVNNPNDPGGETKYGIAKASFPDLDIKNLTVDDAKKIYYSNYWNTKHMNLDTIAEFSAELAIELFDSAVNQGVGTAAEFLQESLNLMNRDQKLFPDMTVDSFAGPTTMKALHSLRSYDKPSLLKVFSGLQFMRYYDIVKKDPTKECFFSGWMKRV